ncbi:MAG TPA: hypothetical protein VGS16_01210 [Candidatus Dormibacteraeota bacterium]|nr:hypothetical protein [Candidatus Dormibacteraeota bacterium]
MTGLVPGPDNSERKQAVRRSLKWVAISYVPLLAGFGWIFFAANHWAGSRGGLLGASGLMIGVAASAALFLPFLRVVSPNRRVVGMSVGTYTLVSIVIAIAVAAGFAVAALAQPQ